MKLINLSRAKFVVTHLFKVIGLDMNLIDQIKLIDENIEIYFRSIDFKIVFPIICFDVKDFFSGNLSLSQIQSADKNITIPILGDENISFAQSESNVIRINYDIISIPFMLLTFFEEYNIKQRDIHDRFLFEDSVHDKYNFIDFPLVDEYAIILKEELIKVFPLDYFDSHFTLITPTHDIDEIKRFYNFKKTVKTILADLVYYKSFSAFLKSLFQFLCNKYDPYSQSILNFIYTSKQFGLVSEFYFMASAETIYDFGYVIDKIFKNDIIDQILENNMIVGLHPSYYTLDNLDKLLHEKRLLENQTGITINHTRQHFLRFNVHSTLNDIEKSKIFYDSTCGFPDREGFKCGTSHPYLAYDLTNEKVLNVLIRPLIAMDVTLKDYRKLTIEGANNSLKKMFERCCHVRGEFIILWHNRSASRDEEWYNNVYLNFLNFATNAI